MGSVMFRNLCISANCLECEWRDAEACGECEIMIGNPFQTFEEQYEHCPFRVIAKRHPLVPVPPHGRLIDADELAEKHRELAYELRGANYDFHMTAKAWVDNAPTIIPADKEGDT